MKKKIAVLSALAVILCAGCSNNNSSDSSNVESSSSSNIETSSADNSSSTESSIVESNSSIESSSSETENSSQSPESNFPEEFTGYVGETLYGADAVEQLGNGRLDFEGFTYVRWATPVFDSTLKTPDLINRDTYEMPKYDDILTQKDPKWFVVKPGDKLENGLVVKSASCSFEEYTTIDGTSFVSQSASKVVFEEDNTLTLTGILYCEPQDDVYVTEGDLYFFADSTNSLIPHVDYDSYDPIDTIPLQKFVCSDAAFIYDGFYFRVGNIDSNEIDLSGIIKKGGVSEVKVTLDNISLNASSYGGVIGAFGNIVSIEKIG